MNYCPSCGIELLTVSKFCHECGIELIPSNNSVKTGSDSINIGVGVNGEFKARDIYVNQPNNGFNIEYEKKSYGKPINVSAIKKLEITAGVISVISGCFTILTTFESKLGFFTNIPDSITGLTAILGIGCVFLWSKSVRILNGKSEPYVFGRELKKIDKKTISKIAIVGACPICGGKVLVQKNTEDKSNNKKNSPKLVGICENSPDEHRFTYDQTVMKGERIR